VHVYLLDVVPPGNLPPEPSVTLVPSQIAYGEPLVLDASASSDPDGTVASFEWDYADGVLDSGSAPSHAWSTPGTRQVRLTVRDDDGTPATAFVTVDVGITSLCTPAPRTGCLAAAKSSVTLKDPGEPSKRRLTWKWKKGTSAPATFGDPTASSEYALCVYGDGGLVLATGMRPDAAKWTESGGGFKFKDRLAEPGGVSAARLKPGESANASIVIKGQKAGLPESPLPFTLPVTVQLVTDDPGTCWEGVYAPDPRTRNTAELFKAKQPS
jgi:hypothetical protein